MIDDGSDIAKAVEGLAEFGCCKESLFPFVFSNLNQKPLVQCYKEAKNYRIKQGMQLRGDLDEMKACLAEGYPFVFGLAVFPSFVEAATNGGRVPMPNLDSDEDKEENASGHAMLAVGYSDRSECFIVRNSWGEEWGEEEYCYMPYQYMARKDLCEDIHAIRTITEPSFDEIRPWIKDDSHDYYHSIWPDKSHDRASSKSDSMMSYILWLDKNTDENAQMTNHLGKDPRVHMIVQPVFVLGVDYLSQNKDRIKSLPQSSVFQIVCRGFYKSEYKNALDLLPLLKHYQLEDVPIIVITSDKEGVIKHFDKQAESMGIEDWKSRIFVTSYSTELITQINANLIEKCANRPQ